MAKKPIDLYTYLEISCLKVVKKEWRDSGLFIFYFEDITHSIRGI